MNGLKVTLVVGKLLNLINHGNLILDVAWSEIHIPKEGHGTRLFFLLLSIPNLCIHPARNAGHR
ncbi:MAG: hypothetical protein O7C75_10820 [Verrucomicrobia bacterium]|nr:hypothetical protein [Verrucomicrobiota bacterium]